MFKISTVGWHTYMQSLAEVFHYAVNGFSGKTDQINWIASLNSGTVFWIFAKNSGKCTRRAANMNQPSENQPTSILAIQVGRMSQVLQMINTAARLVRAHLDFSTSWGQVQWFHQCFGTTGQSVWNFLCVNNNFRPDRGCLSLTHSLDVEWENLPQERNIHLLYGGKRNYFDILNHLGVIHYVGQTDR